MNSDQPQDDFEPGSLGCHEAYHMTSVLMTMIDTELCEHPAIKQNEEWIAMAEAARTFLYDLYLNIALSHADDSKRQPPNYYQNDRFDEGICDNPACRKLYRGPAIYCSSQCAQEDALDDAAGLSKS